MALWLLATFFIDANFTSTELVAEITTDAADVARVYFSPESQWDFQQSSGAALNPGWNRAAFAGPFFNPGAVVRLAPGDRAATYRIHTVYWLRGGVPHAVRLDALINPHADINHSTIAADALVLTAQARAAQLIVPAPGLAWQLGSLLLPIGLPLIGLALVRIALRRNADPMRMSAIALGACATFYVAYYLAYQSRLPHYDDWRYLYPTPYSLVDGGWHWLTVVSNDTYYLTNQLIDYIVLRVSNVSFFWVRAVALGVLVLQLSAQYLVIQRVTGTERFVGAVAIALGIWSLASGAYWGATAVGYQQSLPTLFATLCLLCFIARDGSFNPRFSLPVIVACCLAAGLAYISGSLLILALGVACLLAAQRLRPLWSDPPARVGFLLCALGAVLLVLQVTLVWRQQGSLLAHNHASAPSVYPNDRRFWLFFCAQFGRALGYTGGSVFVDIACAALALGPGILLGGATLSPKLNGSGASRSQPWTLLAIYAAAGAATYAAIVAFGRAGFVAGDADVQTIVATAKSRFHFWPVAAMLPYSWLGWVEATKNLPNGAAGKVRTAAAVLMLLPKSPSAFDQTDYLRVVDTMSKTGAHCVVEHLADIQANQPVVCGIMTGELRDLGPTLRMLQARHASLYQALMEDGGLRP